MPADTSLQARRCHRGGKGSHSSGFFHLQPGSKDVLRCTEGTHMTPLCTLPCGYRQDKVLQSFMLVDLIYF